MGFRYSEGNLRRFAPPVRRANAANTIRKRMRTSARSMSPAWSPKISSKHIDMRIALGHCYPGVCCCQRLHTTYVTAEAHDLHGAVEYLDSGIVLLVGAFHLHILCFLIYVCFEIFLKNVSHTLQLHPRTTHSSFHPRTKPSPAPL